MNYITPATKHQEKPTRHYQVTYRVFLPPHGWCVAETRAGPTNRSNLNRAYNTTPYQYRGTVNKYEDGE